MNDRLELHHVEHLLKACERSWPNGSKESLLLGGAMAVVATIVKQRDAAEDALAAAREEQQHALRVALNVIDELEGFFLKPHPPEVTDYWRNARRKYLVMRIEDAKALAVRAAPGTP